MRLQQLSCDGVTLTLSPCRLAKRQCDGECGTFAGTLARGNDLAKVFFDNSIADRKAEAGALPSAATRKERFEQVLHDVVGHAAAVIGDNQTGFGALGADRHGDRSTRFDAVEPV